MLKQQILTVEKNTRIKPNIGEMVLKSESPFDMKCGQFVNLKLRGLYLRRPISVCDIEGEKLTLLYKAVGRGTYDMLDIQPGTKIDTLMGLGNGFDLDISAEKPLLIGGGIGLAPLYLLLKELIKAGKSPSVLLGFANADECYYDDRFKALGANVYITTVGGSRGTRGFVTNALDDIDYDYFYACGPEPMLKAVNAAAKTDGQLSFERRMGCGFGACMGCSCKTITGSKQICKDGPVLKKGEVVF